MWLPSTVHGIHDLYAFLICLAIIGAFDLIVIYRRLCVTRPRPAVHRPTG